MPRVKRDDQGFVLLEIVIGIAILAMVGSLASFGLTSFFKLKWRQDTAQILTKAREAYLEHYLDTGVKVAELGGACSTDKTKCYVPQALATRMDTVEAIDGFGQKLLLWTNVTVNGEAFDAAICSSNGDTDYGPVPNGSGVLAYDSSRQLCAFLTIPTNNSRDSMQAKAQAAVDAAKSIWTITKSTADDPGCDSDPDCVATMALNDLLDWSFAIDPWGHAIRCDTSVNPKVFYSAGPDGCYGTNDPAGCPAGSDSDNITN